MVYDLTHDLGPENDYTALVGRASEAAWEKDPILARLAVELDELIHIISYNDDRFVCVMKKAGEVEARIKELKRQQEITQRLEKPCASPRLLGTWACLFDKTENGQYFVLLKNGRFLERYDTVIIQKQQPNLTTFIEDACVTVKVSHYKQNTMILYSDKKDSIRICISIHDHENAPGTRLNTLGVEMRYCFDNPESAKTFWQGIETLNPVAFFLEPKWFSKCFTIPEGEYSISEFRSKFKE